MGVPEPKTPVEDTPPPPPATPAGPADTDTRKPKEEPPKLDDDKRIERFPER